MPKRCLATAALAALIVGAAGAQTAGDGADPGVRQAGRPPLAEGRIEVGPATLSTEDLVGTDITSLEHEKLATIADVLVTAGGDVENVVAAFGGFLGFGESTVLLTLEEIDVIERADRALTVRTKLTRDALEARPEHEG